MSWTKEALPRFGGRGPNSPFHRIPPPAEVPDASSTDSLEGSKGHSCRACSLIRISGTQPGWYRSRNSIPRTLRDEPSDTNRSPPATKDGRSIGEASEPSSQTLGGDGNAHIVRLLGGGLPLTIHENKSWTRSARSQTWWDLPANRAVLVVPGCRQSSMVFNIHSEPVQSVSLLDEGSRWFPQCGWSEPSAKRPLTAATAASHSNRTFSFWLQPYPEALSQQGALNRAMSGSFRDSFQGGSIPGRPDRSLVYGPSDGGKNALLNHCGSTCSPWREPGLSQNTQGFLCTLPELPLTRLELIARIRSSCAASVDRRRCHGRRWTSASPAENDPR